MRYQICFVILLFSPLGIIADKPPIIDDDETCPNIDIGEDLLVVKKDLSNKVYDSPIDGADEDTEAIIDELRCLAESGDCYQKGISYIVALWLSAFLPHLDSLPAFCPLAQLINASVSRDPDQLRCALDVEGDFEKILSLYRQQNSIDVTGCSSPSVIADIECNSCWESGFAYEIDILWKRRGNVLPNDFCGIVHRLYESDNTVNRMIALFISYSITEQIEILIQRFPLAVSLQATSLEFGCEIPECCCPNRLSILQTLSEDSAAAAKEILDSLKPPCTCPSLCVSPDDYSDVLRNTSNTLLVRAPCSLTEAGEAVRDELKELANSDNKEYNTIAGATLNVYTILSTNLELAPSFCVFASFINETVVYASNKKKSKILDAIDGISLFSEHYWYLNHLNSISASGCKSGPIPKPNADVSDSCYKNGFAYDVRRIWSLRNKSVPPSLPKKVYELYKSKSQLDRLLALILTVSIADSGTLWTIIDQAVLFQSITASISAPLPKCCCCDRLEELSTLESSAISATNSALTELKGNYCVS